MSTTIPWYGRRSLFIEFTVCMSQITVSFQIRHVHPFGDVLVRTPVLPECLEANFTCIRGVLAITPFEIARENQRIILRKFNNLLLSFNKGICVQGGAKELGSLEQRAVDVKCLFLRPTITDMGGEEANLIFYVSSET